jgi:acetyl esterase/lipase
MKLSGKSPALMTLTAALFSVTVVAQDKSTYYTVMHPKEFAIDWTGFYTKAEQMTAETRKALPHTLDLAYGADPKQKLDVYQPAAKTTGAPVFIFLHGGGFREGDRAQYGYVARTFARHGIVTVVASYRLLPAFHYPDQANDAKAIVAWVAKNIQRYGGDPGHVFVGGHSAGAMLTAQIGTNTDWLARQSLPAGMIKGCAPISGSYNMERRSSDYVPDPAKRTEANPMANISHAVTRWVISAGSAEASNPPIDPADSEAFAAKLRQNGAQADVLVLQGMNHSETVMALSDENGQLFQAILGMIDRTARARTADPRSANGEVQ